MNPGFGTQFRACIAALAPRRNQKDLDHKEGIFTGNKNKTTARLQCLGDFKDQPGLVLSQDMAKSPKGRDRDREEMLLQLDGSHHAWLEDRGPWLVLLLWTTLLGRYLTPFSRDRRIPVPICPCYKAH